MTALSSAGRIIIPLPSRVTQIIFDPNMQQSPPSPPFFAVSAGVPGEDWRRHCLP